MGVVDLHNGRERLPIHQATVQVLSMRNELMRLSFMWLYIRFLFVRIEIRTQLRNEKYKIQYENLHLLRNVDVLIFT